MQSVVLSDATKRAMGPTHEQQQFSNQWLLIAKQPGASSLLIQNCQNVLAATVTQLNAGSLNKFHVAHMLQSTPESELPQFALQAASQMMAVHLQTVLEISRIAKSLALGLRQLLSRSEFDSDDAKESLQEMVAQTFTELCSQQLEKYGFSYIVENTSEWEDYDELFSALDTFPTDQLFNTELEGLLTNQPKFDLPSRIAVSKHFQAAFSLLPKAGRVLYAAVTGS